MRYAEYRPLIKSGDVIAHTHRGIRSWYDLKVWLVRLFEQSEYTHVAVAWVVGGRVFLLEAVGSGVRIFPLSLDLPFFHLPWHALTDAQLEFALAQAGKPYSYVDCVEGYLGVKDTEKSHWQCSKYVAQVLGLPCPQAPSAVVAYLLENGAPLTQVHA